MENTQEIAWQIAESLEQTQVDEQFLQDHRDDKDIFGKRKLERIWKKLNVTMENNQRRNSDLKTKLQSVKVVADLNEYLFPVEQAIRGNRNLIRSVVDMQHMKDDCIQQMQETEQLLDQWWESVFPQEAKRNVITSCTRYMIRKDMPSVREIEEESFEFPWPEEDMLRCLRQRNCIGMVNQYGSLVDGFMIYELHKSRLHLLNFAVHPGYRRRGIGNAMMETLTEKVSEGRRNRILLEVRETNLAAQCFYRDAGFRAVSVLRDFYDDTTEDAYLMKYDRQKPQGNADTAENNAKEGEGF